MRRFSAVVGAPERTAADGTRLAPEIFVTRMVSLDRAEWYVEMGALHILHAGERCRFHRRARVGEQLTWRAQVESITEKLSRGGRRFWLVVSKYPVRAVEDGEPVADIWRTRAILDDGGRG